MTTNIENIVSINKKQNSKNINNFFRIINLYS